MYLLRREFASGTGYSGENVTRNVNNVVHYPLSHCWRTVESWDLLPAIRGRERIKILAGRNGPEPFPPFFYRAKLRGKKLARFFDRRAEKTALES